MADGVINEISGGIFFSAVIQGQNITVHLPREVTTARYGFPARSPIFTGRQQDLEETLGVLAPLEADPQEIAGAPVCVVAIAGMPGIGKTELAVQAARAAWLRKGWFSGGALFTDMMGYDPGRRREPAEALDGLLRALGMPGENIPAFEQDRARLYASVLAKYAEEGQRILVVIDNASSAEQVKPLLPTDEATRAIVTSRDDLGMAGTRLVNLGVLTCEESVEVLDRALRAAHPGDPRVTDAPDAAAKIADLCAGLPLALQIIAALLAEDPGRSLPAMAADLAAAASPLEEMQIGERAVRAAFDLSYQRLDPQRARLFRLLPVNSGPDILIASTAALAGTDSATTRHDLETLARAHLIERTTPHSNYRRWRMHDLLRLYAQELSGAHAETDGRERARDRLLDYYLHMVDAADTHLRALPGAPVTTGFTDRESALAWLDAERANLVAAVNMAAAAGRDQAAMRLSANLGREALLHGWINTSLRAFRLFIEKSDYTNLSHDGVELLLDCVDLYRQSGDRESALRLLIRIERRCFLSVPQIIRAACLQIRLVRDLKGGEAARRIAQRLMKSSPHVLRSYEFLNQLARVERDTGRIKAGLQHANDARKAVAGAGHAGRAQVAEAEILYTTGSIERLAGMYANATKSLQASAKLRATHEDNQGRAYVLLELAMCALVQGRENEAADFLAEARSISGHDEIRDLRASAYANTIESCLALCRGDLTLAKKQQAEAAKWTSTHEQGIRGNPSLVEAVLFARSRRITDAAKILEPLMSSDDRTVQATAALILAAVMPLRRTEMTTKARILATRNGFCLQGVGAELLARLGAPPT